MEGLSRMNVTAFARPGRTCALDRGGRARRRDRRGQIATFGYDACAVAEWIRSIDPGARCVYESGVTGFDLQKKLSSWASTASSARCPDDKARRRQAGKNDRNDAEFLARMLSVGNIVECGCPTTSAEPPATWRAPGRRPGGPEAPKAAPLKFLLRHGLVFDERTPSGQRKGQLDRRLLVLDKLDLLCREGGQRRIRLLCRRGEAGRGRQEALGEAGGRRGVRPRWKKRSTPCGA